MAIAVQAVKSISDAMPNRTRLLPFRLSFLVTFITKQYRWTVAEL